MIYGSRKPSEVPPTIAFGVLAVAALAALFIHLTLKATVGVDGKRIGVNPLIELDFKSRKEIFDLRRKYVMQHADLLDSPVYEPSPEVFGAVEDNKPWWGMKGYNFYGNGRRSIEGLSEQSRHIANPFLLVGLVGRFAHRVHYPLIATPAVYPQPVELVWNKAGRRARVTYDVSAFWMKNRLFFSGHDQGYFALIAYNARDLGYRYLSLDLRLSSNAVLNVPSGGALQIPYLLHVGQSCGYPGGCNNVSPAAPQFHLRVTRLPARAYLKLWRDEPESPDQPADMTFVIEMR